MSTNVSHNVNESGSVEEEDLTNLADFELNLLIDKRASALAKFGLRVLHNGAQLLSSLNRLHAELNRRRELAQFSRQEDSNKEEEVITSNKRKWGGEEDDTKLSKNREFVGESELTNSGVLNTYPLKYLGKRT